jgi:cell division septal protein FtsQ
MSVTSRTRPKRPWLPWLRVLLVLVVVAAAGYIALDVGQRYLGLQKLTIEQVSVSGCQGERLEEVQRIADRVCLGKPLFWFDADKLRGEIEARRWVKGLLIRRDPPDRLSLVVEERKPLLWLVRPSGTYLLAEDGILMDRVGRANLLPIPVVADPKSQGDAALVQLIRAASVLRNSQASFYERLTELRWSERGPVAFLEGLPAPIYLSRHDAAKNIPNFQGLFLDKYAKSPEMARIRYFDLRWDDEVAVGEPEESQEPKVKGGH